jgi:hypothetical protein
MADYISIHLEFEGAGNAVDLLSPTLSSSFFKPVSLGGLQSLKGKDYWFLSGYALENFLSFFLDKEPNEPVSIELAVENDSEECQYINFLKEQICKQIPPFERLSPFEKKDPIAKVTFLDQIALDISTLKQCQQWYRRYPKGVLYLYGTINLAVKSTNEFTWKKSFRYLHLPSAGNKSIGTPFLYIRAATDSISPVSTHIMVHSNSHIWLKEGRALGGRVGQQEADENLAGLVSLVKLMIDSDIAQLQYADLGLEGSIFEHERDRISSAFSNIITSNNKRGK